MVDRSSTTQTCLHSSIHIFVPSSLCKCGRRTVDRRNNGQHHCILWTRRLKSAVSVTVNLVLYWSKNTIWCLRRLRAGSRCLCIVCVIKRYTQHFRNVNCSIFIIQLSEYAVTRRCRSSSNGFPKNLPSSMTRTTTRRTDGEVERSNRRRM